MQITAIDTRQGTDNNYRLSHGNALPLTGVPFAMNYFTVQNDGSQGGWFFNPRAHRFEGFRLTHQPSPWVGDFSKLLILPINQNPGVDQIEDFAGSFDPEAAVFSPVKLALFDQHYQIASTLIPSTYGATLHSEYNHAQAGFQLQLPGQGDVHLDPATRTISGYVNNISDCEDPDFKMYFEIQATQEFDLKATLAGSDQNPVIAATDETHWQGQDLQLCFFISGQTNDLQLATSFLSAEQAHLNLQRQQEKTTAEQLTAAIAAWQHFFDRIEIKDQRHHEQVQTFYTTLYRLFLFPQKFYELGADGQPYHYDTLAKAVKPGYLYTNNGFWDTYKTVYPFYSIIAPEILHEMLQGFLTSYRESGYLPKWLSPDERGMMPGTLIDAVIADAASKDLLTTTELNEFLAAMEKAATVQSDDPKYGRRGTYDYLKYGYVPNSHDESVNHTLDYAYSDYCIAIVAEKAGRADLAAKYQKRALNYRNIFDTSTGFLRPKNADGTFQANFRPLQWGHGYTEGSVWQNGFAVYQDIEGLANCYGGREQFYQKLVELVNSPAAFEVGGYGFEIHEMTELATLDFGQLALSNQPSFHIPYLFSYVDHPEMTQLLVKQLCQKFNAGFDGYPGDEDNGSMAGWFVLSALGFYPVTPGSGEFVLGMPMFDQVVLHLPQQKEFTLTTRNNNPQNQFVQAHQLNGQSFTSSYLTYEQIMAGGEFTATLGLAPEQHHFSDAELPFSISK